MPSIILQVYLDMFIAILPLICLVLGLLMYALATQPKVVEIGRLTYFAGLLSLLFHFASRALFLLMH